MNRIFSLGVLSLASLSVIGCSFALRSPDTYRADTAALLETRNGAIKACYDEVLKSDKAAQGAVTVTFTVQKDTGNLVDVQVDPNATTAPAPVSQCVVSSLQGLALAPADEQDAMATFVYQFTVNAPAG